MSVTSAKSDAGFAFLGSNLIVSESPARIYACTGSWLACTRAVKQYLDTFRQVEPPDCSFVRNRDHQKLLRLVPHLICEPVAGFVSRGRKRGVLV